MKRSTVNYLLVSAALLWLSAIMLIPIYSENDSLANMPIITADPENSEDLYPALRISIKDLPINYGHCTFTLSSLKDITDDPPEAYKDSLYTARLQQAVMTITNRGSQTEFLHTKDIYFYGTIQGRCSSIMYQPANRQSLPASIAIEAGTTETLILDYKIYNHNVTGFYMDVFLPDIEGQRIVIPTLAPEDAMARLQANDDILLLDVRSTEAYSQGHLRGAISLPMETVQEMITTIAPNQGSILFINCKTGKRSYNVCMMLYQMGYENVHSVGGMDYWPDESIIKGQ